MAIVIKRIAKPQEERDPTLLQEIGILPAVTAEPVIPVLRVGASVVIVANPPPGLTTWAKGDTGKVKRFCKGYGMHDKRPEDDMYFVELDKPRVPGKAIAYLKYPELKYAG